MLPLARLRLPLLLLVLVSFALAFADAAVRPRPRGTKRPVRRIQKAPALPPPIYPDKIEVIENQLASFGGFPDAIPVRSLRAVLLGVEFGGWLGSCQGLRALWRNTVPTDSINHYEVSWSVDPPGTPPTIVPGNALGLTRFAGPDFHSRFTVTLVQKSGARYTASSFGGATPHSYPSSACSGFSPKVSAQSGASYAGNLAPDSIASVFSHEGFDFTSVTGQAFSTDLPKSLFDVQVFIGDSPVGLFYVSPKQINFHVPPNLPNGLHALRVVGNGRTVYGDAQLNDQAPSIFTANQRGNGVAAGYVVRAFPNGEQRIEPIATCTPQAVCTAIPIRAASNGESLFLILFGTGYRAVAGAQAFLKINGHEIAATYAGNAPGTVGQQQFNFPITQPIRGRLSVQVRVRIAGPYERYWDSPFIDLVFES